MGQNDDNGNGRKRRLVDREVIEKAAENSVVKLSARLAMILVTAIGIPLVGYLGHRMVTQLDLMADQQGDLKTSVAVLVTEIKGLDRRVRNLEWNRRAERDDERPGIRQ